jgi:hypothetical protein
VCANGVWVIFYPLVLSSLYNITGDTNPRSEIPVRRPHADANRPGTPARAMVRKNASTLLGIFFFIILQMSSARGDRYYDGGVGGGEVDKEDYSTRTLRVCICYMYNILYRYTRTLNTMSLAVYGYAHTIIIQAYIDILGTVYTRDLSIIGRCHPSLLLLLLLLFFTIHTTATLYIHYVFGVIV